MKMTDAVTHFHAYLLTEKRVAKNTFDAYKNDLEQFVIFAQEKNVEINKVSTAFLKEFIKHLKNKELSASSQSRKLSCLKTFFSFLHDRYEMKNVASQLVFPRLEKKLPHYLTEEQVGLLLKAADKDTTLQGTRNKIMVYLIYVTGMRVTELVQTMVSAIDFSSSFLTISGKGGRERMVPMPTFMTILLKEYLEIQYPALLLHENKKFETRYLFPTFYKGKLGPMSRQMFWMYVKKLAQSIGIKHNLSPHQLRHSLATHLLKKGSHLRALQLLLGHEQLSTVQIYTHVEMSHLRRVYDEKHPRS